MITKLIKDSSDEDFARQCDVNVKCTFNTLRAAVTQLADMGSIINFSSTTTKVLMPTHSIYATKGAVDQLPRVFA